MPVKKEIDIENIITAVAKTWILNGQTSDTFWDYCGDISEEMIACEKKIMSDNKDD